MASAEEPATIRLSFSDSEENFKTPVFQEHTTRTGSAAKLYPADRDALALPLMSGTSYMVNERGKILIEAKGDSADTVESEESEGQIPIKLIHLKTGAVVHRILRLGDAGTKDFSGFDATNDVVLNITDFVKLGAYTVPNGYKATLDAGKPVHVYLGDDTA